MFDVKTLPKVNISLGSCGDYRITRSENTLYLINDYDLVSSININNNNHIKQMYSSYDLSYGDVLISGLDFGILPMWILNKESVNSVTVIEKSKEIIQMFVDSNGIPEGLTIICEDANIFSTSIEYDSIFVNHFDFSSGIRIVEDVKDFCRRVPNHDMVWFWPLERVYADFYYQYIEKSIEAFPDLDMGSHTVYATYLTKYYEDFYESWGLFLEHYIGGLKMPPILEDQINEYVYTFFNKIGYGGNYMNIL